MATKVYGYSDDNVEIEGDVREEFGAFRMWGENDDMAHLGFSDGTILKITYGSEGVWRIVPIIQGSLFEGVDQAPADDEDNYSDVANFADGLTWVTMGPYYASTTGSYYGQ